MEQKHAMAHAVEAQDAWVFEGGMSSTYDSRAARADTLIWLDLPVALRFWRVVKRLWQSYGTRRPDMAEGCVETVGSHTWEFFVWIFQTRISQRNKIAQMVARHPHLKVHHLQSRKAVVDYMASVDGERPSA